jgi:hypothetical protein
MGFFRKSKEEDVETLEPEPNCPHVALSARWDDLDDMGHEDRASSWICQSCSEVFTPEEVNRLRESEADRIGATN